MKRKSTRKKKTGTFELAGVIHLAALPGAPHAMDLPPDALIETIGLHAVREAKILEKVGFDRIILENFGDIPFYGSQVPPETIVAMSLIAAAVRSTVRVPVGINVLRNDGRAALSIAALNRCEFIRVNVLSGVAATDQGMISGEAAFLLRERQRLGAMSTEIWADILVKHATTLNTQSVELALEEVSGRGGADAVIITGATTGRPVQLSQLQEASRHAHQLKVPLWIGSGLTVDNLAEFAPLCHGAIVGSALRSQGRAGAPLDLARMKAVMKARARFLK